MIENMNDLNQHFMPFIITFLKYFLDTVHNIIVKCNLELSST